MTQKIDPREIINPRMTLKRREGESEEQFEARVKEATVVMPAGQMGAVQFAKPYTKEEREEQQRKLMELLKKRK